MLTRRQLLQRTLQGSSLLAVGTVVPQFLARTALAAPPGKDTVLVAIEMTGGNDGLNTVIPYGDDAYHKARPTLRLTKEQVVRIDDHHGLHPGLRGFDQFLARGELAVVQGTGYPNPNRSHFESMDVWQSGDPRRRLPHGWVGRSIPSLPDTTGNGLPVMHVGPNKLPLALQGAPAGVVSINEKMEYRLEFATPEPARVKARRRLLEDVARTSDGPADDLLQFVQRRELQTYTTLDRLEEVLRGETGGRGWGSGLSQKLRLVAKLIDKGFGTRVFYVALDGFDTHSDQAEPHRRLLEELADGVSQLYAELQARGHAKRTVILTFSEFGRRVHENGSKGTDHGSGSCLFVAGPAVKGGLVGKHPSLTDLDDGDLRYHIDFRRVYATLLDGWLGVDSRTVLGERFEHLPLLKART